MATSVWSGLITFGLVSIPVKLYSATDSKSISFNQLHGPCMSRINQQRWCPVCNRQVEYSELEKGYEVSKGKFVIVTKEELDALPLPTKQTLTLTSFVEKADIDMVYHDVSYYVEPDPKAQRPFALLMHALVEKNRIGIGKIAIRNKERLCALRPVGGVLMLDTLLYPDEIRVATDSPLPATEVSAQELAMAGSLIDMMAKDFDPSEHKDHYREALEKVINDKTLSLGGGEEAPAAPPASNSMPDLMEALRASVENMQSRKVVALQSVPKSDEPDQKAQKKEDKKEAKEPAAKKGRRAAG